MSLESARGHICIGPADRVEATIGTVPPRPAR